MARKPLFQSPSPASSSSSSSSSSSDDDEQQQQEQRSSSSYAEQQHQEKQKQTDSSFTRDEDDDVEDDEENTQQNSLPFSPPPKAQTQKKPMNAAQAPITVLASPVPVPKRKATENGKTTAAKKARRENNKVEDEGVEKKPLFQRLWSEDDEVAILEGMIDYKAQNCTDPIADADGFLEFVKKSLHVDVNRGQIVSKIRTLRRKFETAKKKKKITDPHGIKVFELSKKVWESNGLVIDGVRDQKDWNLRPGADSMKGFDHGEKLNEEREEEREKNWEGLSVKREVNGGFLKAGMRLLDEGTKAKFEEKWRKQNLAEMEVYLKRLDLIRELTEKTLNAIKSA